MNRNWHVCNIMKGLMNVSRMAGWAPKRSQASRLDPRARDTFFLTSEVFCKKSYTSSCILRRYSLGVPDDFERGHVYHAVRRSLL